MPTLEILYSETMETLKYEFFNKHKTNKLIIDLKRGFKLYKMFYKWSSFLYTFYLVFLSFWG